MKELDMGGFEEHIDFHFVATDTIVLTGYLDSQDLPQCTNKHLEPTMYTNSSSAPSEVRAIVEAVTCIAAPKNSINAHTSSQLGRKARSRTLGPCSRIVVLAE